MYTEGSLARRTKNTTLREDRYAPGARRSIHMPPLEGVFRAEPWSTSVAPGSDGSSVTLSGNSRAYLFDGRSLSTFDMRQLTLRFTVDVHEVPCGTNAALYFVASRDVITHMPVDECKPLSPAAPSYTKSTPAALESPAHFLVADRPIALPSPCHRPPADCDMQTTPACVEIDVFEGNYASVQTTVHTSLGSERDGTCK